MINDFKKDLWIFYNAIKKLKVSRIKLFIIFILMISSNILQLVMPLFFGNIINGIINKSIDFIKLNLLYTLLAFIISNILNYLTVTMLVKLSYNLEFRIKEEMFTSILNIPYIKFLKIDKGKLINNIENDTAIFSGILSDNINTAIQAVNMIISFLFMLYISPILTITLLITFPITGIMYVYSGKKIKIKEIEYRNEHDQFISFLYESISGLKFLKVFNAQIERNTKFKESLSYINKLQIKKFNIEFISQIMASTVTFIVNNLNVLIAVYLIFNGNLTLGMFTAFNEYSETFKSLVLTFSKLNSTIQQLSVSISRVNEILKYKKDEINKKIEYKKINENIKKIEVRNLHYFTQDNIEVLNDINIEFCKGNIYVIKGESGSGKTTLLNILSKFIDDYKGDVLLNKLELRGLDEESLRSRISYITQDNYLFSMSIKENISLYRNINFNNIVDICKRLNIHEAIMALPNQYDTVINKNGTDLSGGQRQRLCIARSIVSNSDVYLFDEITSAIDQKNITEVINIIESISKNSIVLLTTHEDLKFTIPIIEYHLIDKKFKLIDKKLNLERI
ncbi:hypothetical protein UT300013_33820 [Paraclostridium sordellii]